MKFRDNTDVGVSGRKLQLGNDALRARIDGILGAGRTVAVWPTFSLPPSTLDARRKRAADRGFALKDMTAYVQVQLASGLDPSAVITALKADPAVETAYAKRAITSPTATAPNFMVSTASPTNFKIWRDYGITAAAAVPGATGTNVRVADIEQGLNLSHEEFVKASPNVTAEPYTPPQDAGAIAHGTMTASVVAGQDDGHGITGVAHNSAFKFFTGAMADTITRAATEIGAGNVLLLEAQWDQTPTRPYAPIEIEDAEATAIRDAVAAGVIVIEPAGNGYTDFDAPGSTLAKVATIADTGAIMVGAGMPPECGPVLKAGQRAPYSNHGDRVDVQGATECLIAGTSELSPDVPASLQWGTNANNRYQAYSGTSGASAFTAGVAAGLAGAYRAKFGASAALDPLVARDLLTASGVTDPTGDVADIGPRVHLKNAIDRLNAAPDTTLGSGATSSAAASKTFSFSSPTAGVTGYACRVFAIGQPKPAFGACSGATQHTASFTQNGQYRFEVRAKLANGNYDPIPAVAEFLALPNAATVSTSGDQIMATAKAGMTDAFTVRQSSGFVTLTHGTAIRATGACTQASTTLVKCPVTSASELLLGAGDQADTIDVDVQIETSILGGSGNDTVRAIGSGYDSITGDSGDDTLTYAGLATPVAVSLDGIANDGPIGNAIDSVSGIEIVEGGDGNDVLSDAGGAEEFRGNGGNDTFVMTGGGNDYVYGGSGNDTVTDGAGDDTYLGEGGNDVVKPAAGRDYVVGGPGTDTADYSAAGTAITVTLDGNWNDGVPGVTADLDSIGTDVEKLIGTSGDDSFYAGSTSVGVTFEGAAGNDTLMSGTGNDTLVGGSGADSLSSGGGNDTLFSKDGAANDTVIGGSGTDTASVDVGDVLGGLETVTY